MRVGKKKQRGELGPSGLKLCFFLISLLTFFIKEESKARPARTRRKKKK